MDIFTYHHYLLWYSFEETTTSWGLDRDKWVCIILAA
jgi:hypothetical protein